VTIIYTTQAIMTETPAIMTETQAIMIAPKAPPFPKYLTVSESYFTTPKSLELIKKDIFDMCKALDIGMNLPDDSKHPYEWYCTYKDCTVGIAIFATDDGHLVELRRMNGSRFTFSDTIEEINKHLKINIPGDGVRKFFTSPPLPKDW